MRQLRVKPRSVFDDQRLFPSCLPDYSRSSEDTSNSYRPGWMLNGTTDESYSRSIQRAFQYQTSDQLDSYLYLGNHANYRGGGYVYGFRGSLADLRSNVSMLRHLEWINNRTRAILIDLTLYNPNAELFTSVTLIVEILSTGGFHPSARFKPLQFYGTRSLFSSSPLRSFSCLGFTSLMQLICTILYALFVIPLLIREIRSFHRLRSRYFRQFWSLIELGMIVCSCVSIGVYINLQLAVYVNDIFTFFFGCCSFFATIRFIRLFRSNARISLFIDTLHCATRKRLSFPFMFSIVFFSFMVLFYLLFVSKIVSCATLLGTAQMLFEISLMKFDTSELIGASASVGPLAFTLFIFLVVFVCPSIFLSIINESFRRAQENVTPNVGMFTFILSRCLLSTGNLTMTSISVRSFLPSRSEETH